jgi:DNA-directed RNA polymerase specialized sigma24 family protein
MDAVETGSLYVFNEREDLERSARYLVLIGLFKELSPVYQEILSLRFIEDKSNKEIADLLGRSNRYVALKVHRGLKSLRGLAVERGLLEKLREGGSTEESD